MGQTLYLDKIEVDLPSSRVLRVNGAVRSGEPVLLQGPSGCGKSTLLRALAGLGPLRAGICQLDKRDLEQGTLQARRVGFMFQSPALFTHMNVLENLIFPLRFQPEFMRWSKELQRSRARDYLQRASLEGLESRAVNTLSGGERQRLVLMRALIWEPDYLLLDEPFSAVDETQRGEIQDWMRSALAIRPVPTLVVSHDGNDAKRLGARVLLWSEDLKI